MSIIFKYGDGPWRTFHGAYSSSPLEVKGTWRAQGAQPVADAGGVPGWAADLFDARPDLVQIALNTETGGVVWSRHNFVAAESAIESERVVATAEPMKLVSTQDEEDADSLRQQLATAERLALVAGLPQAAQWIRDHSAHAVVWVEDADMHPVEMLAWVAKERGLKPITCAVCGYVATEVDSLHPYHQEWDRCAAHRAR